MIGKQYLFCMLKFYKDFSKVEIILVLNKDDFGFFLSLTIIVNQTIFRCRSPPFINLKILN